MNEDKTKSKPRRIVVSVTNDLVTDQRVHRTCQTLHDEGYAVTLVGRRLRSSTNVERDYTTHRMSLIFNKKALFYAEYNIRLLLKLLFAHADAFYANDTDTLPATFLAARIRRKPMVFDAHELFPEVPELVNRPRAKNTWIAIERYILPRLASNNAQAAAITVCSSIAQYYKKLYGLDMAVVRNVPTDNNDDKPASASPLRDKIPNDKRILLYQGAVNIGRGIEWVVDAMPYLPDCHFVIAGVGDTYNQLVDYVQHKHLTDRVTFMGRVQPSDLNHLTPMATLGISLLENRGLNYYYALPNRIADFVHASVPVLATDFPEIHAVIDKYKIGTLVAPTPFNSAAMTSQAPDAQDLARTISSTIAYWDSIDSDERRARFAAASADMSWNNDKKTLIKVVDTIFQPLKRSKNKI